MKKPSILLIVILAVLVSTPPPCIAQGELTRIETQCSMLSSNVTSPPDSSWVFVYLPLGKYRFDTSVLLDQLNQNKVSPAENDDSLELKAFTLQFSLKW